MNFRPELAALVMSGRKTVTRRVASENPRSPWYVKQCGLRIGRDYAVCPGRGKVSIGRVEIVTLIRGPIGHLDMTEAYLEGFETPAEFEQTIAELHGSYDPSVKVWRVEFRVKTATS